jgi:hypothetical protein
VSGARAVLLSLLAWMTTTAGVRTEAADSALNRENQLKAGYLLNFAKLVEWPATAPADTLTICVAGASGLYDTLASGLGGKRIGNRTLAAYKLAENESRDRCSVLYVDAAASTQARSLPDRTTAALTVSDAKNFARSGGIIELFTENNRLRFIINLENARHAGLRVNPNLLQLAASVYTEAP